MELREKLSNKNWPFLSGNFCLRVPPEAPFYWKLFKIGMPSVKYMRKDVLIFQVWESAPAAPPLPVFTVVVLPHTEASGQRLFRRSVHISYKIQIQGRYVHALIFLKILQHYKIHILLKNTTHTPIFTLD